MGKFPVLAVVAALLLGFGSASASAAPLPVRPPAQAEVDAALAAMPGGTQTGPNTASWNGGEVTFTAVTYSSVAVGTCASGYFCAYSSTSLAGNKWSFSSCRTYSTAGLIVRSIANARNVNSVRGQNLSATTLVTVLPGGKANTVPAGITQLACG